MQACELAVVLYVLCAHGAQAEPAGPVYAALQTHRVCVELPEGETAFVGHGVQAVAPNVVEYVLAPQVVHVAEPVVVLYVPARHAEQTPPSGPVKPVSHGHTVSALPPAPEFDGQFVQSCGPLVLLYVAVRHGQHEPPFGPE